MPFREVASGLGSAPKARANHTALGLSALGPLGGLGIPNFPSPDSATHFVSSFRTGSSTAWPRCFCITHRPDHETGVMARDAIVLVLPGHSIFGQEGNAAIDRGDRFGRLVAGLSS